jgi:hypothetical protein
MEQPRGAHRLIAVLHGTGLELLETLASKTAVRSGSLELLPNTSGQSVER